MFLQKPDSITEFYWGNLKTVGEEWKQSENSLWIRVDYEGEKQQWEYTRTNSKWYLFSNIKNVIYIIISNKEIKNLLSECFYWSISPIKIKQYHIQINTINQDRKASPRAGVCVDCVSYELDLCLWVTLSSGKILPSHGPVICSLIPGFLGSLPLKLFHHTLLEERLPQAGAILPLCLHRCYFNFLPLLLEPHL